MDRPIIFSAPMVRALLDGRKTQTRRLLKPHPLHKPQPHTIDYHDGNLICRWLSGIRHDIPSPYAPGDRLYVREAWCALADNPASEVCQLATGDGVAYRATDDDEMSIYPRWRPSIHMPRWASRITLTVTDVRVQRLQDISEADAVEEGVDWKEAGRAYPKNRAVFADLWNSLHGSEAWDANPWVVAVSFTVRKGNIDAESAQ